MKRCTDIKEASLFLLAVAALAIGTTKPAFGRPEYALKHRINQCTACHVSPTGGSPRNLNGKKYGARQFELYEFSAAKYLSADTRVLYYQAEGGASGRGGLGLMATNLAVHVPLDAKEKLQLVFEQSLSGFVPSGRDAYIRHAFGTPGQYGWTPQVMQVGRFHIPFGIATDEHRTYVRQQSATTWNHFETGFLAAADINDSLHYDLGLLNGVRNAGAAPSTGGSAVWGGLINVRWMPRSWPFLLGASYNYHQEVAGKESPSANSLYSMLSLDRLSGDRVNGTLLAEVSFAHNYNSQVAYVATKPSTYLTNVEKARSRGLMLMAEWNLSSRWSVHYKYDELIMDDQFPGDGFTRHGVGAKYVLGPNMLLWLRADQARATPAAEANSTAFGATSVGWLQLQASL